MNMSESGCCGHQAAARAEEQAATAPTHQKEGCGCKGEEKAQARSIEPAVTEAAGANTAVRGERKRGCC